MTDLRRWTHLIACAALTSCAAAPATFPAPSPAEIPGLEAAVVADSTDVETGLRLASAYRESDRLEQASALVAGLLDVSPDDPGLTVMAGVLAEDRGDVAGALAHYRAYLSASPSGSLRAEVERRVEIARREGFRAEIRDALARESELSRTAPNPGAVGVFPFAYDGSDPAWAPLGPAIAELLITDLGITGRLQVLERVKVQALVDEMALADAGFVETATAARSGRLLGSGHVVQGRFRIDGGDRIAVDAAVVEVGAPGAERTRPVSREDAVTALFELEKQLALDLHQEMGIQLTPSERQRIDERQTESVQALLAFGRGLLASDAGEFSQAEQQFAQASELDPSFVLARNRRQDAARAAGTAAAAPMRDLGLQASRLSRQRAAVRAIRDAPVSVRQQMLAKLSQRQRSVLAEVLGQDRVGTQILLELVFRRPGGQQ